MSKMWADILSMLRTCEPADCEVFEAGDMSFSDTETEEISRIIRDYKEKRK